MIGVADSDVITLDVFGSGMPCSENMISAISIDVLSIWMGAVGTACEQQHLPAQHHGIRTQTAGNWRAFVEFGHQTVEPAVDRRNSLHAPAFASLLLCSELILNRP